jgi:hypothetical protein
MILNTQEDRTRTSDRVIIPFARFEAQQREQFERQLPREIVDQLAQSPLAKDSVWRPRVPTYRSITPPLPVPGVVKQPPPSPLRVWPPQQRQQSCLDVARTSPPSQTDRNGSGSWWLVVAAVIGLAVVLGLLQPHASSTLSTQPPPQTPPVEVRRALPAALRALPIDATPENPPYPYAEPKSVRMPDGSIIQARYQGRLPNAASLPPLGRFIGEAWLTADGTAWIWAIPAGATFPSWVDP